MSNENKTGINWNKVALRNSHGVMDLGATLKVCEEELSAMIAADIGSDVIESVTAKYFDKLTQGGKIPNAMTDLDGLASGALRYLDEVPAGQDTRIKDRIKDFVRGESKRFTDSNGGEGKYVVVRGKLGGVRISSESFVKEYREMQAKKTASKAAQ